MNSSLSFDISFSALSSTLRSSFEMPQIGRAAVDFRATLQLCAKPFLQLIYICPNLLEERASYSIALIKKSGKKMFVRDFRMIRLRSEVLCRLQRFLHLLRVSVDAHAPK